MKKLRILLILLAATVTACDGGGEDEGQLNTFDGSSWDDFVWE